MVYISVSYLSLVSEYKVNEGRVPKAFQKRWLLKKEFEDRKDENIAWQFQPYEGLMVSVLEAQP